MASKISIRIDRSHGFTLLETLIALAIASLLITTLIPISRNALFRISSLSDQVKTLSIIERVAGEISAREPPAVDAQADIELRVRSKPLPQFSYPRDQREKWQPVLVTIEAKGKWSGTSKVEIIKLERSGQ